MWYIAVIIIATGVLWGLLGESNQTIKAARLLQHKNEELRELRGDYERRLFSVICDYDDKGAIHCNVFISGGSNLSQEEVKELACEQIDRKFAKMRGIDYGRK